MLTQLTLAQDDSFDFEQLVVKNFPTQSITYSVKQDSIGNIWIASEEGVLKYNSKTIKMSLNSTKSNILEGYG